MRADPPPARRRIDGAIVTITLDRPDKRNAINSVMAGLVRGWLSEASTSDDVGCVVLTGTDPAFCAGLDLVEYRATGRAPAGARELIREVAELAIPVIAAVNGPVYTGGLEIALGCDVIVASERASFADTHVQNGLMPGGGLSVRLAETVGVRRAKRISFTGLAVLAEEALRIGLADAVVGHTELLETANTVARDIVAARRAGVIAMKALYRGAIGSGVDAGLAAEASAQARWREHMQGQTRPDQATT